MSLVLRCTACSAAMVVRPRHRGRDVPCPACGAELDMPAGLGFREMMDEAIAQRRAGHRLQLAAAAACILWLPVIPALVAFIAGTYIRRAVDVERVPPESLIISRNLALVAFVAQSLSYVAYFTNTSAWSLLG